MRVCDVFKPLTIIALGLIPMQAGAGEFTFSANWTAPSTQQGYSMSQRKATSVVLDCSQVSNYASGRNQRATVVAGPHTTQTDHRLHLTVRLYAGTNHVKSCHTYVDYKNQNYSFRGCSCDWL